MSSEPAAPASSMDLLGGLNFASSPIPSTINNFPPVNNTSVPNMFGGGGQGAGPMSLPTLQPASALAPSAGAFGTQVGATNNGASPAGLSVGDTWKDLGKLFIPGIGYIHFYIFLNPHLPYF